jgi:membrane fusion protein, copper/silver efflux system
MKKTTYTILLLLLLAGAFWAGSLSSHREVATPHAGSAAPTADLPPGSARGQGETTSGDGNSAVTPPGAVRISADKQQLIGVKVSAVEKTAGTQTLRLFGRVAPDEARVYKLSAGIDGYIREVSSATTGSRVKKDELLAKFSAPNAASAIQTYILNVGAADRFGKSAAEGSPEAQSLPAANANVQLRVQQLQNLGMSLSQMEEIKRTRQVPDTINILAPADGFVLSRNVSPGQKFERGAEWYRVADLSRVWILADVFENDAHYLRPGVPAQVLLPNQQRTLQAKVAEVLPQFDGTTRTLKVRLEAANPDFVLRPDMFVDVALPVTLASAIAIPVDAVLDSGLKKTVFVDHGGGVFEPRQVETGWRFGDRVEITNGLTPGERIVVSGTFLLDSESRLKPAAASGGAGATAPGASRDGGAAAAHSEGGQDQPAHGHSGH